MISVSSIYSQWKDASGEPLENGSVYIGTANLNPETNPISVYWDVAGTQPAAQPLETSNGFLHRTGTPANVFVNASDYSITVRDVSGSLVTTTPSALAAGTIYALNANLTVVEAEIAALQAITITGAGVATGGGALTGNQVITVTAASVAQQVAGTSNVVAVTPLVQKNHPSSTKGWASINVNGGTADSYNVTGITDVGSGKFGVTWTNSFATNAEPLTTGVQLDSANTAATTLVAQIFNGNRSVSYVEIWTLRMSDYTAVDPNYCHIIATGLLA